MKCTQEPTLRWPFCILEWMWRQHDWRIVTTRYLPDAFSDSEIEEKCRRCPSTRKRKSVHSEMFWKTLKSEQPEDRGR